MLKSKFNQGDLLRVIESVPEEFGFICSFSGKVGRCFGVGKGVLPSGAFTVEYVMSFEPLDTFPCPAPSLVHIPEKLLSLPCAEPATDSEKMEGGFDALAGGVPARPESVSLRAYFMAHAPAEPQQWFKDEYKKPKPEALSADEMYRRLKQMIQYDSALKVFSDALAEARKSNSFKSLDEYEKKHPENHGAVELCKKQLNAIKYDERAMYIQWPAAWADAMLSVLAGKSGDPDRG